jgi:hypothetical protein
MAVRINYWSSLKWALEEIRKDSEKENKFILSTDPEFQKSKSELTDAFERGCIVIVEEMSIMIVEEL